MHVYTFLLSSVLVESVTHGLKILVSGLAINSEVSPCDYVRSNVIFVIWVLGFTIDRMSFLTASINIIFKKIWLFSLISFHISKIPLRQDRDCRHYVENGCANAYDHLKIQYLCKQINNWLSVWIKLNPESSCLMSHRMKVTMMIRFMMMDKIKITMTKYSTTMVADL